MPNDSDRNLVAGFAPLSHYSLKPAERHPMARYFKKEIPSNPLFLPSGRRAPFRLAKSGNVGILAVDNRLLLNELDKIISKRTGGVVEIDEDQYLRLEKAPPKPKRAPKHNHFPENKKPVETRQLGHGRMIFNPIDSGIRTVGRFIHVVERHQQSNPDAERRVQNAFKSWVYHYDQGMLAAHLWKYPRSARAIGDSRDLPYLKDVISAGLKKSDAADDIILLTNDDTVLHQNIVPTMTRMLQNVDALSSFRMNFKREDMPALDTPTAKIRQWGETCLGRDLFAFRAEWLRLNWKAIPDFVLGEIEFDLVLAVMARIASGVQTTKENFTEQQPACELDRGYVLHESHSRNWALDEFANAPAKIHNNKLCVEWMADNGLTELIGKIL